MVQYLFPQLLLHMPGTLFVVATPIGNLEDITARALRVLSSVAVIAAEDTRRTAHLLSRYAITTPTTSLHEHNEHQKAPSLVDRLRRGDDIALVSDAGTPAIADPGRRLVREAVDAGIKVEAIPGPNAAVAALAVSGFETDSFSFLGFPPVKANDRMSWFEHMRSAPGTVVFYEAPHRIVATLRQMRELIGDCDVVVARELTKLHEELVRGPISTILDKGLNPRGEFTVVANIGQVTNVGLSRILIDSEALAELGDLTDIDHLSRREAVGRIARRYNLSSRAVYAAIERAKKSGE